MGDWSIYIEVQTEEAPGDSALEDALTRLEAVHGVLVTSAGGYGARLSVSADTYDDAQGLALAELERALEGTISPVAITHFEAQTAESLDRNLAEPTVPDLVGVAEVADMLAVSRQRVSELRSQSHFPAPVAELKAGPVWALPTLNRFVSSWERRPGRRPRAGSRAAVTEAADS